MKKFLGILFLIVFTLTLPCISADSMAAKGGWQKYEDWEDYPTGGFVSDDKWSVMDRCSDQNIADVSIEDYDGSLQAKFTYTGGPGRSCNLLFNECPERIVGIKADVTIASCQDNQDCRARVGWHRGITPDGDEYVWEDTQVRPNERANNRGFITSQAIIMVQRDPRIWESAFSGTFENPLETIGETFTVSAIFDKPDQVEMTVEGQGTIIYSWNEKLGDPIELFKGIGMLVFEGDDWNGDPRITDGDFVVYFDNIYIKTKGSCDNKKPKAKIIDPKKNMPLDACWVSITFDEPMDTCCRSIGTTGGWPVDGSEARMWSDDQKTFSISRTNCDCDEDFNCTSDEDLPANTKIEFVVNPDGTGFMDLKGNEAKKKKLTIKTE